MHSVGESGANVPAFLAKLWKIVEDPALDDLISWNSSGLSFTIRDQARFARELLPLYYKHNNMASFVRQLNMYGFHKVVSLDSGGLKLDKDEMEFAHTYFIRGHECLLEHIKRKIPVSKQDDSKEKPEVLSKVLSDVRAMRGKQETLDSRLATMKRENEALWREVASLRQKHLKQQQIVNKLIHFLISVVQPNGRSGISLKRRVPLMLQAEAFSASPDSKNSKKQQRVLNINAAKGLDKSSPIIANISPGGPIIHDVTDLIDDIGEDGVVEVPVEQEITLETVPHEEENHIVEIPEPANEVDVQIPSELLSEQPTLEILPHERDDSQPTGLDDGQPDLSLIAQLQENDNSAMLASPLSPELLLAVNPSEIVGKRSPAADCITPSSSSEVVLSGKFGGEPVKDKDSKKVNGKSSEKETEMRLAVIDNGQNSLGSRNELDNHLDTIQMDLENLREILSLQPGSVDPTTLLGLFSADEPNIFLNGVSEIQRPMSSTSGNELISYNPSLFELTSDDGQFLPDDANLLATGLVEEDDPNEDKTDGLLNLLGFTDGPTPAKKTKSS